METVTAFFILLLMAIAAKVADGIYRYQNMWKWIVAYWVVLTLKNALDFAGGFINGF